MKIETIKYRKERKMRLIIVRHGDPNYEIDSLTEKGWREAEFLSVRMEKQLQKEHTYIYTSPLGRAKDTASLTLKKLGMTATEFKWLREFEAPAIDEDTGTYKVCWDLLPARWTSEPAYYDKDQWMNTPFMKKAKADTESAWVYDGLDSLLKKHGYTRENGYYRAEHANRDTIVLFCHLGVECVMLGHLLGISPVVLWHGTAAAPSSVATLYTEERREGIASFRMQSFGDLSHLYAADEPASFAARFCETYDNKEERHD